jgi:hypothetical protein
MVLKGTSGAKDMELRRTRRNERPESTDSEEDESLLLTGKQWKNIINTNVKAGQNFRFAGWQYGALFLISTVLKRLDQRVNQRITAFVVKLV